MASALFLKAACVMLFVTDGCTSSTCVLNLDLRETVICGASTCVSGCDRALYERVIDDFCLAKFKSDMGAVDQRLWCSWPDTTQIYEGLTNCTYQVALRMDCFWPGHTVDRFFVRIHRNYFHDCQMTGRLIHDPPASVLAPFVSVPILVTLLVTALVVWRSKHTEGIL